MYHNTEPDDSEDEADFDNRSQGWWSKFKDAFLRDPEDEGLEEEQEQARVGVAPIPPPSRKSGGSSTPLKKSAGNLRMENVRETRVTVRQMVQSHEDVQRAVEGLREGVQQIINFEQTPADKAKELTDFMYGAIYAIEGSVDKIGDQVFLFSPGNVIVDVQNRPATSTTTSTSFFDKP